MLTFLRSGRKDDDVSVMGLDEPFDLGAGPLDVVGDRSVGVTILYGESQSWEAVVVMKIDVHEGSDVREVQGSAKKAEADIVIDIVSFHL